MGDVQTYDANRVHVLVGGLEISGFADGESITIEPASALYKKTVGLNGNVSRSRLNDSTAKVTLKLKQTASDNAKLLAFQVADAAGNSGIVPLVITDLSGAEIFMTAHAWVETPPKQSFAREEGSRDWVFDCGESTFASAGHVV